MSDASQDNGVRRSSRATKGQHSRLQREQELEAEAAEVRRRQKREADKDATKAGGDGKKPGRRGRKAAKNSASSDEGSVRCVCGATEVDEKDERSMCECESCLTWQHVECMFGVDDENVVPEGYVCHDCRKKALAEEAAAEQGGVSAGAGATQAEQDDNGGHNNGDSDKATGKTVTKREREDETETTEKKRKKGGSLDDLKDKVRRSVAEALLRIFSKTLVPDAKNKGLLPNVEDTDAYALELSLAIEKALYDKLAVKSSSGQQQQRRGSKAGPGSATGDVGPAYRDKFRSLSFNLKDERNGQLHARIVTGELTPVHIATLTREEMMNPEMQKLAESVREESIRETTLQEMDDVPRVRRTHKGDELVEVDKDFDNNTEQSGVPVGNEMPSPPDPHKWEDLDEGGGAGGVRRSRSKSTSVSPSSGANNGAERKRDASTESDRAVRQRSVEYDAGPAMDDVVGYSPAGSPANGDAADGLDDDDDIDDIIGGDDDRDTETSRPGNGDGDVDPEPLTTIWTGGVTMQTVAAFPATIYHLCAGPNFDPFSSWSNIIDMTGELEIDGRLDEAKAAAYLMSVRASRTIAAFILESDDDESARRQFDKLYDYFHSRAKYGVIKHRSQSVKDAYVVTLSRQDPVPEYLPLAPAQAALLRDVRARSDRVVLGVYVIKPGTPFVAANAAASSLGGISRSDTQRLEGYFHEHPEAATDPALANDPQQLLSILERYQDRAARS